MKITALRITFLLMLLVALLTACSDDDRPVNGGEPEDSIRSLIPFVIRDLPHNGYQGNDAFTQGLLFHEGLLYESNGLTCCSNIRTIDPATGAILKSVDLYTTTPPFNPCVPSICFGEGIALKSDRVVQLTWRSGQAFGWSIPDLYYQGVEYTYAGHGWGLTNMDSSFVMSNGTDTLYVRDGAFTITRKIPVTYREAPLDSLNELEFADGLVYANVLGHQLIYGIDPLSGIVNTVINCSTLVETAGVDNREDPLNGIAYNDSTGYFYVTGKNWPLIFEVFPIKDE